MNKGRVEGDEVQKETEADSLDISKDLELYPGGCAKHIGKFLSSSITRSNTNFRKIALWM